MNKLDFKVDAFLNDIGIEDNYKNLEEKYDALSAHCNSLMGQLTAETLKHDKTKRDCKCSNSIYTELKQKNSALETLCKSNKEKYNKLCYDFDSLRKFYDKLKEEKENVEKELKRTNEDQAVTLKEIEFLRAENKRLQNRTIGEKRKRVNTLEEFCSKNSIDYKICCNRLDDGMPFKTGMCRDLFEGNGHCPRGKRCYFAHTIKEMKFFVDYRNRNR